MSLFLITILYLRLEEFEIFRGFIFSAEFADSNACVGSSTKHLLLNGIKSSKDKYWLQLFEYLPNIPLNETDISLPAALLLLLDVSF